MIRNEHNFVFSGVDWEPLAGQTDGCLPSDVDGMIEKNGKLLMLESKRWNPENGWFEDMGKGQEIAFNNLSKTPLITVLVIWATRKKEQPLQLDRIGRIWCYRNGKVVRREDFEGEAGMRVLERFVNGWFHQRW